MIYDFHLGNLVQPELLAKIRKDVVADLHIPSETIKFHLVNLKTVMHVERCSETSGDAIFDYLTKKYLSLKVTKNAKEESPQSEITPPTR